MLALLQETTLWECLTLETIFSGSVWLTMTYVQRVVEEIGKSLYPPYPQDTTSSHE